MHSIRSCTSFIRTTIKYQYIFPVSFKFAVFALFVAISIYLLSSIGLLCGDRLNSIVLRLLSHRFSLCGLWLFSESVLRFWRVYKEAIGIKTIFRALFCSGVLLSANNSDHLVASWKGTRTCAQQNYTQDCELYYAGDGLYVPNGHRITTCFMCVIS